MSDTQWPRYEVFKQDTADRPHQAVGSVHAPDAELALLNARDVFVRRPRCHSLWVVPTVAVLMRTAEELTAGDPGSPATTDGPPRRFHVFRKTSQRRSMTFVDHAGDVEAPSAEAALTRARAAFPDPPTFVWWIVPADAVTASREEDVPSMFLPADDKTYRHQSAYGFVGPRRQVRRASAPGEEDE